jgi:predicted DNA-binding transcriptional regulator AlpA
MSIPTPHLDQALKELNTPAETAAHLGLSIPTLARWRMEGVGPRYRKLGGAVRYTRGDIEAYIEASLAEAS